MMMPQQTRLKPISSKFPATGTAAAAGTSEEAAAANASAPGGGGGGGEEEEEEAAAVEAVDEEQRGLADALLEEEALAEAVSGLGPSAVGALAHWLQARAAAAAGAAPPDAAAVVPSAITAAAAMAAERVAFPPRLAAPPPATPRTAVAGSAEGAVASGSSISDPTGPAGPSSLQLQQQQQQQGELSYQTLPPLPQQAVAVVQKQQQQQSQPDSAFGHCGVVPSADAAATIQRLRSTLTHGDVLQAALASSVAVADPQSRLLAPPSDLLPLAGLGAASGGIGGNSLAAFSLPHAASSPAQPLTMALPAPSSQLDAELRAAADRGLAPFRKQLINSGSALRLQPTALPPRDVPSVTTMASAVASQAPPTAQFGCGNNPPWNAATVLAPQRLQVQSGNAGPAALPPHVLPSLQQVHQQQHYYAAPAGPLAVPPPMTAEAIDEWRAAIMMTQLQQGAARH